MNLRKRVRCKACGEKIDFSLARHYVVRHSDGLFSMVTYFDAFDCQKCGTQYIVGVRELEAKGELDGNSNNVDNMCNVDNNCEIKQKVETKE